MDDLTNLQKLLEPRGVSARICKEFGLSPGNVGSWKLGKSRPSALVMYKLASLLGVSVEYLLDITPDPTPPERPGERHLSPAQQKLVQVAQGLSDEALLKVLDYADLVKARHDAEAKSSGKKHTD
jgi:transcriptional regulator with XRE-family HTH domain